MSCERVVWQEDDECKVYLHIFKRRAYVHVERKNVVSPIRLARRLRAGWGSLLRALQAVGVRSIFTYQEASRRGFARFAKRFGFQPKLDWNGRIVYSMGVD